MLKSSRWTESIFCLLAFMKLKKPQNLLGKNKIVSEFYVSTFPAFLSANPTSVLGGNVLFSIIPINYPLFCFSASDKASVTLFKGKNSVCLQF